MVNLIDNVPNVEPAKPTRTAVQLDEALYIWLLSGNPVAPGTASELFHLQSGTSSFCKKSPLWGFY